jgi:hypothetical protein
VPGIGFVVCNKCQHRSHKGSVCRYPTTLLRTPGKPLDLCGCSFGMWIHDRPVVDRREDWIKVRAERAFRPGSRRVNAKPGDE